MRFNYLIVLLLLLSGFVDAQQLPLNPDPNKCYVRTLTPDVYETYYDDYLTYSKAESVKYSHEVLIIRSSPEISRWETVKYEGCQSSNPDDCQILCYRTIPAVYDTIYEPLSDTLGAPYYREIETTELVERGGISSYQEMDCELTTYRPLSIEFEGVGVGINLTREDKVVLNEWLVPFLRDDYPEIRIQINVHTDARGDDEINLWRTEEQARSIVSYLVQQGVNRGQIAYRGYGESQLTNVCSNGVTCNEWEHEENNRVSLPKKS